MFCYIPYFVVVVAKEVHAGQGHCTVSVLRADTRFNVGYSATIVVWTG